MRIYAPRFTLLVSALASVADSWDDWWTYDGFQGPNFWGLVNPEWRMCAKGQHQSPINIDPNQLLFDPFIKDLLVDKGYTRGVLVNSGQQLILVLENDSSPSSKLNVTGGPLGAYRYRLHHLVFHFPKDKPKGSEHTVDGERFPAELQFLGYNVDLYRNFSEAMRKPDGLVGISVMIDVFEGDKVIDSSNPQLIAITKATSSIKFKGEQTKMERVAPWQMMPDTRHYVTYEGSLTYPGCYETVTWILVNKPIYISETNLRRWQNSLQVTETAQATPSFMGDNFRPLKELNKRLVRTNINFKTKKGSACPTMYNEMHYKSNPWRKGSWRRRRENPSDNRLPD